MATTPAAANPFQKAERRRVEARIALAGPSGSGKTYTALALAAALANGGRVACVDTEKDSAQLYGDVFDFDALSLDPPFSPQRYEAAIKAAVDNGYVVVVVDSLSHAWTAEGGVLDIVDQEAARQKGNSFAGWRKGTPEQERLVNALVRSPIHVIATMRSKQEYAVDRDDKGRVQVRKLGLAPVQRDGVEFEFSLFGELDLDHTLSISKSRYSSLQDLVVRRPGEDFARKVLAEVEAGAQDSATEETTPSQTPSQGSEDASVAEHRSEGGEATEGSPGAEPSSEQPSGEAEGGPTASPDEHERLRDAAVLAYGSKSKVILAWKKAKGVRRNFGDLSATELTELLEIYERGSGS